MVPRGPLAGALALALLPALALAAGDSERNWESLYDARLAQALDGTPAAAAMYCQDVLDDLSPNDPLLGQAWYFLGQARAEQGDGPGAAIAWEQAEKATPQSIAAVAILSRYEEAGAPIKSIPRTCDFDSSDDDDLCGLHRVWSRNGAPTLRATGEGRMLVWTTDVKAGASDALEAVLKQPEALRTVAFRIRASKVLSYVRVALDDGTGARAQSEPVQVPTDDWTSVELKVADFRAAEEGGWSAQARLFRIEDLTGKLSEDRGPNELWIDDLELR